MQNKKVTIELDDNKIKKILKIKDVINIVHGGFKKKGLNLVSLSPKMGPKLNTESAFADSMPVSIFNDNGQLKVFGIKWLSGFPNNLKIGLPYLNSLIILNEPKYGLPIAVVKGNWITAIRTSGVSAVCAKYLAPKMKQLTIGIFGLGMQASIHVLAFKSIFKNPQFFLFNHDEIFLNDFLKKFPNENFLISKNHHEVVRNSDIVLSATTFPPKISPYIYKEDLKEDVLLLPIDYGTRVDPALYKSLDEIYTDDIPQYELKSKLKNYFPSNSPKIKKEIGEIVAKRYKRGNKPRKILVFNLGIALFDILTAKLYIDKVKG